MKRVQELSKCVSSKEQQFNRTDTSGTFSLVWLMAVQFIQMIDSRLLEVRIPNLVDAVSGLWWGVDGHCGRCAGETRVS